MLPTPQNAPLNIAAYSTGRASETSETLFQRVRNNDIIAFGIIFKKHYRALCIYSHRFVISRELAEEIVDDVFCNLWSNRKKIQITRSFQAYLIISIRNRSLDCLRKMKGERKSVLDHADHVPCKQSIAYESMVYEELCQQVNMAVEGLPKQCRVIYLMSRHQELPYREIARALNISVKTVDTQIGRALRSIRRSIASEQS